MSLSEGSILLSKVKKKRKEIAASVGVTSVMVTYLLFGKCTPKQEDRAKIKEVYGIDIDAWDKPFVAKPDTRLCLECGGPNGRAICAKYCCVRCTERATSRQKYEKNPEAYVEVKKKIIARLTEKRLAANAAKPVKHHPMAEPVVVGHKTFVGEAKRNKQASLAKSGWTIEAYNEAYIAQRGGCYLCGSVPDKSDRLLSADHCHTTGKARHLLCTLCNRYIGVIEKYGILDKVVSYCGSV